MLKEINLDFCGIHIEIQLSPFVTVISGYSGTGKSFIVNAIKNQAAQSQTGEINCISVDRFPFFLAEYESCSDSLLVVDNADLLLCKYPDAVDALNCDRRQVLLFSRQLCGVRCDPAFYYTLDYQKHYLKAIRMRDTYGEDNYWGLLKDDTITQ